MWQGTLEPQAKSQHCHCIIPHTPRETEVQQGHEVVMLGRYWSWQVRSRGWACGWLPQTELPCSGVWTQRSSQEDDPHKGAAEVPVSIFFGEPGLAHSNVGGGSSLPRPLSGSADLPGCLALSCPQKGPEHDFFCCVQDSQGKAQTLPSRKINRMFKPTCTVYVQG